MLPSDEPDTLHADNVTSEAHVGAIRLDLNLAAGPTIDMFLRTAEPANLAALLMAVVGDAVVDGLPVRVGLIGEYEAASIDWPMLVQTACGMLTVEQLEKLGTVVNVFQNTVRDVKAIREFENATDSVG